MKDVSKDNDEMFKHLLDNTGEFRDPTTEELKNSYNEFKDMEVDMFMVDTNGNMWGQSNNDRWDNAKWWQKILGGISYKYKQRFIDVEGIPVDKNQLY